MKNWKRIAWITSALASPVVLAQTTGMSSPPMSASDASGSEAAFVQQAVQEHLAELELSKIAQNNSTNPVVINFARSTVRNETQANRVLREMAAKKGIQVPDVPDPEHAAMLKVLGSKSGTELDAYYTKDMARTDDEVIELYQSKSSDNDRELASYAQSALPQEEEHEKLAQRLADSTARRAN
jgi:putative membrane protein